MLRQNAPPQERRLFVALGGGAIACVVKGRFTTEDIAFTESKQWLSSVVSVISAVETFLILVWNRAASDACMFECPSCNDAGLAGVEGPMTHLT